MIRCVASLGVQGTFLGTEALRTGHVGLAQSTRGAAFRAGGACADGLADARADRARSAGPALVLGAVLGCAAQDGAGGVRDAGVVGVGVGSPGAVGSRWEILCLRARNPGLGFRPQWAR